MKWDKFIDKTFEVKGTSGDERICVCPFHDDRGKPNLYVNANRGVYICHACGERGHLSSLGKEPVVELSDVREAIKELRKPARQDQAKLHPETWLQQYDFPHPYWEDERGFSRDTIKAFRLGYSPIEDVLTIPLRDSHGGILGVTKRVLDDSKPKYREPKRYQKGLNLFGAWKVRWLGLDRVALVEGPLDAIACWDAGVPALGLQGARLTERQSFLLRSLGVKSVVLMLDNDRAGIGWPEHRARPQGAKKKCSVCGRPRSKYNDEHKSAGNYQVHEELEDTGVMIDVGLYRRTQAKDPGELSSDQRTEVFEGAIGYRKWVDRYG